MTRCKLQTGDLVFEIGSGFLSAVISRLIRALRKGTKENTITHVFTYKGKGKCSEANEKGVVETDLSKHKKSKRLIVYRHEKFKSKKARQDHILFTEEYERGRYYYGWSNYILWFLGIVGTIIFPLGWLIRRKWFPITWALRIFNRVSMHCIEYMVRLHQEKHEIDMGIKDAEYAFPDDGLQTCRVVKKWKCMIDFSPKNDGWLLIP